MALDLREEIPFSSHDETTARACVANASTTTKPHFISGPTFRMDQHRRRTQDRDRLTPNQPSRCRVILSVASLIAVLHRSDGHPAGTATKPAAARSVGARVLPGA